MHPLISIITVNYRNDADTVAMLASVPKATYAHLEVIVVNNGATHDNTALLQSAFPDVKVVNLPQNLGFAGGNNAGLRLAKGKYLYLINNDTELLPNSILPLVERMEQNAKIGAISPCICYHSHPNIMQYAGFTRLHPLTGRNRALGKGQEEGARPPGVTAYTHGAAMMVSREALEAVGLMDESYFLYYEELDWCERIARAGFACFYEPQAKILHKESASTGKESPLKLFYHLKNRYRFMQKFQPWPMFMAFMAYFCAIVIPKTFWKYRHRAEYRSSVVRACMELIHS